MLEELRKKSDAQKQAYAFWGAGLMTGLVALIWAVSLPFRLGDSGIEEVDGDTQAAGAISQFLKDIKDNVSDTWEDSQEVIEEFNSDAATSTVATSTPSSPNTAPVLIGTSTAREAKIATSTAPNR